MPLHPHRIKMPGSKKSQMAKNSKESGIITDKSLALNAVITWTKLVSAREAGFSTDHPLCCKITAMVKNRGMQPESRWAWYCDFHAALVTGPAATTNRGLYSAVQAEAVSPACHQLLTSPLPQIKHNRRLHVHCSVTGFHHQLHTDPFNGPLSRTTQVSRYRKGKANLDFTEARDSEWQWHQLGHMQVCTLLETENHASTPPLSFFTGRMPFLPPNQ